MDDSDPFRGIFPPQPWEIQETTPAFGGGSHGAQAPLPSTPYGHLGATSPMSTPCSTSQRPGPRERRQPVREKLPLLQLEEWNENNTYRKAPPECIRYHLGINVTAKRKSVYKDTRPNLALAPGAYWRTLLRAKMEQVVQEVLGKDSFAKATETYVVVSVKARSTYPLVQRFKGLDIVWNEIEDQLIEWSDHFQDRKNLRVEVTFNYEEVPTSSAKSSTKKGAGRGRTTATQGLLVERDLQIEAEEHSTVQPATWRYVYTLMRCPGAPCPLGPHCWIDPRGKRH